MSPEGTKSSIFRSLFGRISGPRNEPIFFGCWIVVLGAVINAVGGGIFGHGFTLFFLPLKTEFQVSSAAVSLLYAASRLEGGFDSIAVGYLIGRFGPRAVIIAGVSMAGGGLILLSMVPTYWTFFFTYLCLVSIGYNAGFFHPVTALVNTWFVRHRGVAFSWVSASANAGGMVIAPLLSVIIQTLGWRAGAVTAGIAILAIALPAALPIRPSPEAMGLCPDGGPSPRGPQSTPAGPPAPAPQEFSVREALRTRAYWTLMGTISLRQFVTVALNTHFVPILVWGGMSEGAAAYLVSLYALGSIAATMAIGWLGDRWSKPRLCSLGLLPVMLVMIGLTFSHATVLLYGFALGLAVAMGTAPLNWALIGDFFGRHSYATVRGMMGMSYGATGFLAPIFAGWVYDATGSYAPALLAFTMVLLTTASLFAMLRAPAPPRRSVRS